MSVRKREWTTRKGEQRTSWVLDYRDHEGKRRIETFKKKKDADARAAEVAVDIKVGVHVPRGASITVAEAGENWIAERTGRDGDERLEKGTLLQYRQHLDLHINNKEYGIEHIKLADLSTPGVAAFEQAMREAKVSAAMRRKILVSLSSLLREAMRTGQINRNVMDGMRTKGGKRHKRPLEIGKDIPTMQEVATFLAASDGLWRAFFMVAVFSGLRASELRGLKWENVEQDTGKIHVRERADFENTLGSPKTASSRRTVPVGVNVVNALRDWEKKCPASEHGLVFPTRKGGVQSASNIRSRALIPLMEKAGILGKDGKAKYTGLHALRHFYASWLINPVDRGGQGVPPKVVQERMGHSTLAMTMDTYGHLFPAGDDKEQISKAETALLRLAG